MKEGRSTCSHRSGRLPGAYDFSDKTPFSFGGPRRSVARVLGANLGSTSQGARSPVLRGVADFDPVEDFLYINQHITEWNSGTSYLMEVADFIPFRSGVIR